MSEFLIGLLAIPTLAIAVIVVIATWCGLKWVLGNVFSDQVTSGRRVYAYHVVSASGHLAQELVGVTFQERHDRGPTYTYRISFDGESSVVLTANRVGAGTVHGLRPDWDDGVADALDTPVPARA